MTPWIDRKQLIGDAKKFASANGFFLKSYAKRISGLVELAVYHSVVEYYSGKGYSLTLKYPGPRNSFKFKASSAGLLNTSSSFTVTHPKTGETYWVLSNTNIQSAHHDHLYYSPDVLVCRETAAVTKLQKNGRRYSYVKNSGLVTFVEVKHLTPFPEVLYSFSGLVQEFMPQFILGLVSVSDNSEHLTPIIVFTGAASPHVRTIQAEHTIRYGINIIFNTQGNNGRITNTQTLLKFDPPDHEEPVGEE